MPEEYGFEERDQAGDLYIEEGLTYDQVSERTGIPRSTLLRWGQKYEWTAKRETFCEAQQDLKWKLQTLRVSMMQKAVDNTDPQNIYAVIRLEKLALEREKQRSAAVGGQGPEIDRPRVFLEDLEFVAEVLKEVDPEGLKVIARNFEMIVTRFKTREETA